MNETIFFTWDFTVTDFSFFKEKETGGQRLICKANYDAVEKHSIRLKITSTFLGVTLFIIGDTESFAK